VAPGSVRSLLPADAAKDSEPIMHPVAGLEADARSSIPPSAWSSHISAASIYLTAPYAISRGDSELQSRQCKPGWLPTKTVWIAT
jgi:hypothetical protein